METQVLDAPDAKDVTGSREGCGDTLRIPGEDIFTRLRLALDDLPGFSRKLKAAMITFLVPRMFGVTDKGSGTTGSSLYFEAMRQVRWSPMR